MDPTPQDYVIIVSQIAIFVVLWALLKRLWFEPVALVLRERRVRSEGALADAATVQDEVERLRAEHARAIEQARTDGQREAQQVMRAAEAEQKRLVDDAMAAAERALAEARRQIAAEMADARKTVGAEASVIAQEVASVIVGRTVPG